jgi:hypothetical protein
MAGRECVRTFVPGHERIRKRSGGRTCARTKSCVKFERENGIARNRAQLCVQSGWVEKRESIAAVVNSEGFRSHVFSSPDIA